jgi:multidrug efflux system outer membrane protein
LTALSDVDTALVAISTYREQLERYHLLVAANEQINRLTNQLYLNGLSAYLDVIDAERTLYNSQMEYSNLIATQYINYVNLCKALGGGVE